MLWEKDGVGNMFDRQGRVAPQSMAMGQGSPARRWVTPFSIAALHR